MQGYKVCSTHIEKKQFRELNGVTMNNRKTWKRIQEEIRKDAENRATQKIECLQTRYWSKKKAQFEDEETIVHKLYKARRAKGLVVLFFYKILGKTKIS